MVGVGGWLDARAQGVPNVLRKCLGLKSLEARRIISPGHLVRHLVAVGFCRLFFRWCVLVCFGVCVCGVGAFFVDIRVFVILIETFLCRYYFG